MAVTKPAGTWTYEDLFSLPDDGRRYEIIEGALYEMPSPNWDHAMTIMNLILLLAPIVRALGGQVATAPIDVFFPGADSVQPDILVLLASWEGQLELRGPQGAPDLVIEVLSPSNRGHDLLTKRALYGRAGVREYWLVDPANQTVELLSSHQDALVTRQTASRADEVSSPLLSASFALAEIFAGVGEATA